MNFNEAENNINDLELHQLIKGSDISSPAFQKEISFRMAIENAIPSGLAVVDETGKQVFVNNSFCRMTGWEENELLGRYPPYVYWSPNDLENINNALTQTLNNNAPAEGFDLLFRHRNGTIIPVNVFISPFVQENNKRFFLANVIDNTERKKAEEALKKSQILLMSSIESQKDTIIFSVDQEYHYLYFNTAHLDSMKFAYNTDIKIGMSMLDCISSDRDRGFIKDNIDSALKGESNSHTQVFGDVNRAFYESYFNPIYNDKNEIIGCTVLARNISERKEGEQKLIDSEIKFREIINQIKDVIIVFDEQGKIIIWNRGAEEICGIKSDDVINSSIIDIQCQLTPPPFNDRAVIEKAINGILTQETPERFNQIIDSQILIPDSDKIRNIQSMVFPIRLNGTILFCTVIRDTTEIKRYEKELLRISAEKDKFYSTIAQYLYTPFNVFHNFSKLMAEEMDNLPIREIQKMAVMMSKSANNLYNLLDNMLQWTRLNQGKISFEPQKLNLKTISRDAVSILKPHADAKNIMINHYADDDTNVYGDIFMLKTIIRNLVSNAIKFTDRDGQINITARETPSDLIISVWDNGSGISPDYLKKLFDISQIHSTLGVAEEKGTTLGLLLCKEFVEKHGGKIWVESDKISGNEIKFTLPVLAEKN
jgi:PAS domain S-box-containing protein